jgi:uncharacterized iron-regulated membrane protein
MEFAVSLPNKTRRLLERRWLVAPVAVVIGLASGLLLWITLRRDYWDYWLSPKLKAADFYIYPQLRYTLFDIVLLLWCVDGMIVSGLLLWSAVSARSNSGWMYRTVVVYVGLFIVLLLGGSLMMLYVRSRGL